MSFLFMCSFIILETTHYFWLGFMVHLVIALFSLSHCSLPPPLLPSPPSPLPLDLSPALSLFLLSSSAISRPFVCAKGTIGLLAAEEPQMVKEHRYSQRDNSWDTGHCHAHLHGMPGKQQLFLGIRVVQKLQKAWQSF